MPWRVRVSGPAEKFLNKHVPPTDRIRILRIIGMTQIDPFFGDVVKLKKYSAEYRLRVGDWRILFDLDGKEHIITIQEILRRTSKTY